MTAENMTPAEGPPYVGDTVEVGRGIAILTGHGDHATAVVVAVNRDPSLKPYTVRFANGDVQYHHDARRIVAEEGDR